MLPLLVTFFTLEAGDITTMLAYVGNIFEDTGLLIWVAIGLPMGFYVIKRVIGLIPKGR
jgi:hypothetical protein